MNRFTKESINGVNETLMLKPTEAINHFHFECGYISLENMNVQCTDTFTHHIQSKQTKRMLYVYTCGDFNLPATQSSASQKFPTVKKMGFPHSMPSHSRQSTHIHFQIWNSLCNFATNFDENVKLPGISEKLHLERQECSKVDWIFFIIYLELFQFIAYTQKLWRS